MLFPFLPLLSPFLVLLFTSSFANAQLFSPTISSCHSSSSSVLSSASLINITSAYAQYVPPAQAGQLGLVQPHVGDGVIRLDLVGMMGKELIGFDNSTGKLATMFTTTTDLTYNVYTTTTYVCNSIFPPSPLPFPYYPDNTTYCPIPAGEVAINITIPSSGPYPLSTLTTTIRIVDTSVPANELSCSILTLTPYDPQAWYYHLFLWVGVVLAIGFWVSSWAGRFAAGWVVGRMLDGDGNGGTASQTERERERDIDGWGKTGGKSRKWGTMLISGLSGERLGVSGGLLRFITPGFRDIIWHLQFCAVLAMIAINWPDFAYPILAQGAWASLVWNATIVQGDYSAGNRFFNPLAATSSVPTNFAEQFNGTNYPLYMDESLPNRFLNLEGANPGLPSFAAVIGLRPQDMYSTCIVLFMLCGGGILFLSLAIWLLHGVLASIMIPGNHHHKSSKEEQAVVPKSSGTGWGGAGGAGVGGGGGAGFPASSDFLDLDKRRSSVSGSTYGYGKEELGGGANGYSGAPPDSPMPLVPPVNRHKTSETLGKSSRKGGRSIYKRAWWKFKVKGTIGQFHWNALCGNLVRLLVLFHLPVTLFSVYQLSIRSEASSVSVTFAAISFAAFSILLPLYLTFRIWKMPTGKLYDATRTLLSLGPMYNMYKPEGRFYQALRFLVSLATGIVVGAGQKSGIAQAIVLLIIEIGFGLVTIIWQPWRPGAGMAVPTVLFASLRIASAVLLLLMSQAIGLSNGIVGWIAYVLLAIQAFALLSFLVMLAFKILEGLVRLFGNVRFEHSTHALDGGLLSAYGGLANSRKNRQRKQANNSGNTSHRTSTAGSINTQMMLDRHSTRTSAWDQAQYPPSQRPIPNTENWAGQPHHAPVELEEMLSDRQPPPRGFSVNRSQSGRANYSDPYAALPVASPPPSQVRRISQQDVMTSPPIRLQGHQRTRSQTAIVETVPSPESSYKGLPGSEPSSPLWGQPPFSQQLSVQHQQHHHHQHQYLQHQHQDQRQPHGRPSLPPLAIQRLGRPDPRDQGESPTSAYSIDSSDTEDKPVKRGWFGGKGKKRADEETESEDDGGESDVGMSKPTHKGWLAGLKAGRGTSSDVEAPPPMDENSARKLLNITTDFTPAATGSSASPSASKSSFSVKRAGQPGGSSSLSTSASPGSSAPATQPVTPNNEGYPQRSFRVLRQGQGRGSSTPSPQSQRGSGPPDPADSTPPLAEKRSFVVNRPPKPGPVSFQPLSQGRP